MSSRTLRGTMVGVLLAATLAVGCGYGRSDANDNTPTPTATHTATATATSTVTRTATVSPDHGASATPERGAAGGPRDGTDDEGTGDRPGGTSQGGVADAAYWRPYVEQYEWPIAEALEVIRCESGYSPTAYSAGNYGGFQINWSSHYDKLQAVTGSTDAALLYDPAVNTAVAIMVWRASNGWRAPWAWWPDCPH